MRRMKGPAPRRPRRGRFSALLRRFGVWVGLPERVVRTLAGAGDEIR